MVRVALCLRGKGFRAQNPINAPQMSMTHLSNNKGMCSISLKSIRSVAQQGQWDGRGDLTPTKFQVRAQIFTFPLSLLTPYSKEHSMHLLLFVCIENIKCMQKHSKAQSIGHSLE